MIKKLLLASFLSSYVFSTSKFNGKDNVELSGTDNYAWGNSNIFEGLRNFIVGNKNHVKKNDNLILGGKNDVDGYKNKVQGKNNKIIGDLNDIEGKDNEVTGNNNFIIGHGNIVSNDIDQQQVLKFTQSTKLTFEQAKSRMSKEFQKIIKERMKGIQQMRNNFA